MLLLLLLGTANGQQLSGPSDIQADVLEMAQRKGQSVRRLEGNVVVKQKDGTMYADSAFQYPATGKVEAFGHVRMVGADGAVLLADSVFYSKTPRWAIAMGNVVVKDDTTTLTTRRLDYDLDNNRQYYRTRTTIQTNNTTLISDSGTFDQNTSKMHFYGNVELTGQQNTLLTDSLVYNRTTKIADFYGPSTITGPDGVLKSNRGRYNTATEKINFLTRTSVTTSEYIIIGNTVNYNRKNQTANAHGNVIMHSQKDSTIIYGQKAFYDRKTGYSKVTGNPLLKRPISGDSLFIKADTLVSYNNPTDTTKRNLFAIRNVKVYKSDLQAICDSMIYKFSDSALYFFDDPVLWTGKSQLTGDSVKVQLANQQIDRLFVFDNAFVISEDTLGNFNQAKGRNMIAYFDTGQIQKTEVLGNGQSVYFALQGDTALMGMNKTRCSNIIMRFWAGEIDNITFVGQPESRFVPPHELQDPDRRLRGFVWRKKEQPQLEKMLE